MRIVLLNKVDGNIETKGSENAPSKIIEKLKEIWLSESFKKLNYEIVKDEGDLFLGGDHSISYDCFKRSKCNGLLVLDAHPDVFKEFKEASHVDWLRHLIDDKIVEASNVVLVGLRSFHNNELEYLQSKRIKYFDMKKVFEFGIKNIADSVTEVCNSFNSLYISIDLDVVDPGFAPGVNYLEPGGLSSRELIYFIQRLRMLKNLKRVDIVEVNPEKDDNERTSKLAAKLIWELA